MFHLDGIMPAPRGVPQIEVTFDIDANGIVHVSAKDLGTQKEQSISITSSTNMSKEDVDKAVKEAERYAAEDKKRKENIDTRNEADQMVYQCEKILKDNGDKIAEADKTEIQSKIDALKEALKGDNMDDIKAKKDALTEKFNKVAEEMYKAAAAQAGEQQGGAQAGPQGGAQGGTKGDDGYYEADYTDVEDGNK